METRESQLVLRANAPYAVQLRLSPEILAAIHAAQSTGGVQKQLLQVDSNSGKAVSS